MMARGAVLAMDLHQQLVVWKKSGFLLDNIALNPALCQQLVEKDLFTGDMMVQVQSPRYSTERTLKMLTLLGTHGNGVFEKFLAALEESNHRKVAKELRKTDKYTKFGEMLPPSFTYFLDMSEFLRKYPHIAIKLGEDEKHIVQTYIEGKIDIEMRKTRDSMLEYQKEIEDLKAEIQGLLQEMEDCRRRTKLSEAKCRQAEDKVQGLEDQITDLQSLISDLKGEIRNLKGFEKQQSDLEQYLQVECKEFVPVTSNVEIYDRSTEVDRNGGVLVDNDPTEVVRLKLLHSQVNLSIIRLDLLKASLQHMQSEEIRVQNLVELFPKDNSESNEVKRDIISFHKEVKQMRKKLEREVNECENELDSKETELRKEEKESKIPGGKRSETYADLCVKLKQVVYNMKCSHREELNAQDRSHRKEVADLVTHIKQLKEKHQMEEEKLKGRIRQKMLDLHRREMLFKRLKHQIVTIENYFSKNMNAQASVEQCRKIVRDIIGEARKLRAIAEERDQERKDEKEAEGGEKDKEKEEKSPKKKKRKRRRKVADALSDERLLVLAGQLDLDWRGLGQALGLTHNRLDLLEVDATHPGYSHAYKTLLTWRDEEKGKLAPLIEALQMLGRDDLAMSIMPADMLKWALQEEPLEGTSIAQVQELHRAVSPSSIPKLPQIAA